MNIFPYNDGSEDRYGDPMRIERILDSYCEGSFKKTWEMTKSENPQISCPAWDQLLQAICVAFELQPFDKKNPNSKGEEFQKNLLESFLEWRSKKNETTASPPSSPMPTVGGQPSGADVFPRAPQRTKSDTVFGSTSR